MTAVEWALLIVFGVPAVLLFIAWIERAPDPKAPERPLVPGHARPATVAATADSPAPLAELDPVTASRLHEEARGITAGAP